MTEIAARIRANALITVHKYEPAGCDEPAQGPGLTRIHVEESFSGDIDGDGTVEFLQAAHWAHALFRILDGASDRVCDVDGASALDDSSDLAGPGAPGVETSH